MMKKLLLFSILMFSFLLSSKCQVAHVSYRPTQHYGERVDAFAQEKPIDNTQIVMLGNSLTEFGKDWNKIIGKGVSNIRNRGIIGDTAEGMRKRLCQILPGHPKAIFLLCGTNDISHGIGPKAVFQNVKQLIDDIRKQAPDVKLIVQSIPPFNEHFDRWATLKGRTDEVPAVNKMIEDYCVANNITFVNMFHKFTRGNSNVLIPSMTTDGLHFSKLGYKVWASQIRPYIREINKTIK